MGEGSGEGRSSQSTEQTLVGLGKSRWQDSSRIRIAPPPPTIIPHQDRPRKEGGPFFVRSQQRFANNDRFPKSPWASGCDTANEETTNHSSTQPNKFLFSFYVLSFSQLFFFFSFFWFCRRKIVFSLSVNLSPTYSRTGTASLFPSFTFPFSVSFSLSLDSSHRSRYRSRAWNAKRDKSKIANSEVGKERCCEDDQYKKETQYPEGLFVASSKRT
jgi:hypothetical protein